MPKDFLYEILDEFAKVTAIIVEASKIKEDLENSCDLKQILNRTKLQVEELCEHGKSVKKLFHEKYETVVEQLANSETVEPVVKPTKPFIKLVDIKTLVEPKSNKAPAIADTSVVIITSSDEETPKTKPVRSKRTPKRPQPKKDTSNLQANSESESSDDLFQSAIARNKKVQPAETKSLKPRPKSKKRIVVPEFSSDSSGSGIVSRSNVQKLVNVTLSSDDEVLSNVVKKTNNDISNINWRGDVKYSSKCFVKVLKVPCEKLKEYYLNKLDLLKIDRLCNLKTLEKKRPRSVSGSPYENKNKKKKNNQEKSNSSSNEDVDDAPVEDPLSLNCTEDLPLEPTNNETLNEMAEDSLNILTTDKEKEEEEVNDNEKEDSSKETSEKPKEASEEASEQTEKEDTTMKEKENGKKTSEKSDWKKDKLLTENILKDTDESSKKQKKKKVISDSEEQETNNRKSEDEEKKNDSDEEKKTKDKKKSEDSSDEELKAKEKRKRLIKKKVKRAILMDSDSDDDDQKKDSESSKSSSSSSSESEKEKEKPKARRRVKRVRDSSEEDEDGKSTRKQIRNIWGRDSLAETTRKAEDEEKQRKARIAERQRKYNQSFEEDSEKNASVDKVVLDFNETTKEELLKVDDKLVEKLKPHQASGVQFMWNACFESLERAESTTGSGCILAHCMGLGKTLQVITLSHTLLTNYEKTKVKKILVVSPLNTVLNWVNEFKQWLPDNEDYDVYELVSFKQNEERRYQVTLWHDNGGVLIIGYDMFRNLSNPDNKRLSKKMRSAFQEGLVDPGPDLVICDEGHLLKNEKTNLSIAMNKIKTLRRIVLTGTPLQNNLKEYFCMVQFIKPNLLGTYKEYLNRFVNPITNGQYTDSTLHDIQIMRRRSHVLHKMLDGVVQRRDYSVLQPYLKPKFEYVIFLKLTEMQIKLYRHYMENYARKSTGSSRMSFLFVDFQSLQRICTHPRVLLDKSNEARRERFNASDEESEGSLKDFIDDDDDEESSHSSNSSSGNEETPKKSSGTKKRVTRAAAAAAQENGDDCQILSLENTGEKEWWQEYCDGAELDVISHSTKLFLLFEILKECEQIGDKVLVFSQSLYSLNVIEYFLEKVHEATQNDDCDSVGGYSGSWCLGLDYFRLDGSSSCDNRNIWCKSFNKPSNTRARLFLISTRAGGLGINLVAANRVIIFDVSWNPSHDIQSIYRVYRFGQTKPSYIYRFVTQGTMEMKVYERQVTKQAISKRVIDEQQIDRHYNQNDLAELYKFEPDPGNRPIPLVPKDVLLGELLQKYEDRIYKYHEHQSLLENKEEECLNEDERKAAWEEFENEKKQRINLGNAFVRPDTIQLAFATMIKRENPTWTDKQLREFIPILQAQMTEQLNRGELTMYKKIQQEVQINHAIQVQQYKEQLRQQQMLKMRQQQFNNALRNVNSSLTNFNTSMFNQNQMPGTSNQFNPNDVIDLND